MLPTLLARRLRRPRSLRPRPCWTPVGDNGGGRHRRPADTGGATPLSGPTPALPHRPSGSAPVPKARRQTVQLAAPAAREVADGDERPMGWNGRGLIPRAARGPAFVTLKSLLRSAAVRPGSGPAAVPREDRLSSGRAPVSGESRELPGFLPIRTQTPHEERQAPAVGSRAEGRGTLHVGISCRGAASHSTPLSRGCSVSHRIQTSATSYRLNMVPRALCASRALPPPFRTSEQDCLPRKRDGKRGGSAPAMPPHPHSSTVQGRTGHSRLRCRRDDEWV